jgi:hypothetical protein
MAVFCRSSWCMMPFKPSAIRRPLTRSVNPNGESLEMGNFWLVCDRPWSNQSLNGKLLAISDLPGTVTTTAGFKGTVCTPTAGWPNYTVRGQRNGIRH